MRLCLHKYYKTSDSRNTSTCLPSCQLPNR
jgi:hypothetical protein